MARSRRRSVRHCTLDHALIRCGAEMPGAEDKRTPDLRDDALAHAETVTAATISVTTAGNPLRFAARPTGDPLVRAVARARVAHQLFARSEKVRLGRYHLLELVGSGGMGVVWGAWDPELERRVAIKLVKTALSEARDRILREGQALAKLSHPNVVTVYDVGVIHDQVYIVMEWVRGENLRAWGRSPRAQGDVLAVYRAAGEGLAAAHAAGVIHRDFKPDNAVRGDDGRVRVLDFGLARSDVRAADSQPGEPAHASSELTRGAGTPRYMPPEQAEGGALTAAVDQYAFCVSLREALRGRDGPGRTAELPSWLAGVLARGTAHAPADRFSGMPALLAALARDPATVWRRRIAAGAACAAATAAFAIGYARASATAIEPCSGARAGIAQVWNPGSRALVGGHLRTLGAYGADTARRLDGELDGYADRWAGAHRAACIDNERGELTPQIYARTLACLGNARAALASAVAVLTRVPAERLGDAVIAARVLPDAERCAGDAVASRTVPPAPAIAARAAVLSDELARVRVLAQAADPSADAAAGRAVGDAEQLGYPPLIARASLIQGYGRLARGDVAAALPMLERAATTALDAGDDAVFVEAYARELYGISRRAKHQLPPGAAGVAGAIGYAERIARRLGAAAAFERPLLFNNIGVSRLAAGDRAEARAWFARAIDEPGTRAGEVELVSAFGNLALVTDEPAERDRLFARERAALAAVLGPDHIRTLETGYKHAVFTAHPGAAAAQIAEVCTRVARYHPGTGDLLSRCAYELGWLAEERGDAAEARAWMQQVANARKPMAAAYLTALDGALAEAIAQARRAAAGLPAEWWTKLYAADGQLFAALCAERLRDAEAALAGVREALAIYDQLTVIQQAPYYLRRVARARALLARLLAPRDRREASRLAAEALTWYRAAGGYESVIGELAQLPTP